MINWENIKTESIANINDIVNGNLTEETSSFVALIKEIKERYPKE